MALVHELTGFSSYPYAKSPAGEYQRRAKIFNHAFKNGRDDRRNEKSPTFGGVVRTIVRDAASCPAFATPSILVPIPRSGNSRPSFGKRACLWPNKALAVALAGPGDHKMAELLDRPTPVARSSDGPVRVSVVDHVASLRVHVDEELLTARLVLLDDLLVKGTQALACFLALRRAGYVGPIEAFFVHQAIAPNPTPEQQRPFLCHHITWREGDHLPDRIEVGFWRASGQRSEPDGM